MNTIDRPAVAYSIDCRNLYLNKEKSGTLQAKESGGFSLNFINPVLCLNDQGGAVMDVSDKAMTLRAEEHGHQPVVVYDARGNGDGGGVSYAYRRP